MTASLKLTRLLNAEGETVGYFSDHVAEMTARKEWETYFQPCEEPNPARQHRQSSKFVGWACRSIETSVAPAELEDVEPGDGDREDFNYFDIDWIHDNREHRGDGIDGGEMRDRVMMQQARWLQHGAASVEVSRYLVNRWRRLGKSSRGVDLGGPVEAAGVLYVLRVKAPK